MKQKEKKEEGVEFISALMEIVPIPIFYKNKEGVYLGCNKSFEDFLGKKKEEIAGKTVFELSPREMAEVYYEADKKLLESGGTQIYEAKVKHADGEDHTVVFKKTVFVNKNGEKEGIVGSIMDLTKMKKGEEEIEKRTGELERMNKFLIDRELKMLDLKQRIKELEEAKKK